MSPSVYAQGSWITTFTGKQFWPLDPRIEDIDIRDIAHALSMICRFTGHVREFYSVAQHCVLASHLVPGENALGALLHDASEAYLCDVSGPIKKADEMRGYREAEQRLDAVVCAAFNVDIHAPAIKAIDQQLVLTEYRDLMPRNELLTFDLKLCLGPRITPWAGSRMAETIFMARYEQLT